MTEHTYVLFCLEKKKKWPNHLRDLDRRRLCELLFFFPLGDFDFDLDLDLERERERDLDLERERDRDLDLDLDLRRLLRPLELEGDDDPATSCSLGLLERDLDLRRWRAILRMLGAICDHISE